MSVDPTLGKYKILSAITKPTQKNKFEAGNSERNITDVLKITGTYESAEKKIKMCKKGNRLFKI